MGFSSEKRFIVGQMVPYVHVKRGVLMGVAWNTIYLLDLVEINEVES